MRPSRLVAQVRAGGDEHPSASCKPAVILRRESNGRSRIRDQGVISNPYGSQRPRGRWARVDALADPSGATTLPPFS